MAALRASEARALGRIFIETSAIEQKTAAGIAGSQPAAVNHLPSFGGSLGRNLHYHAVVASRYLRAR